jgi:DNA integrity scanning protein DisA with diadenylate cyclase activity
MKHEMSRKQGQSSFEVICSKLSNCPEENLEPLLELAIEIAREGREGRRIGTLFTIGDAEAVMAWSRPLILNPFEGHLSKCRHIASTDLWGTVKELAQLDGAFVVSADGVFLAAGRYLDANASAVEVPFGLGSRHIAAASISFATNTIAIVVSESSIVRVFQHGALMAEIIPELWLFSRHEMALRGNLSEDEQHRIGIMTDDVGGYRRLAAKSAAG